MKYRHTAIAALMLAMTAGPALAQYSLITTIQIPSSPDNTNPANAGGRFTSYDIAFSDPTTRLIYLADRSNASVDIFSAITNTYVGRLGGSGGVFTGQTATTSTSGPDGVVVIPGVQVWAGDGNSTLRVFNIPSGTQPAYSPIVTGPISANRTDELIYDPNSHQVLAANNAASPSPFLSLINTTTGAVTRTIPFNGLSGTPNATNGIEQPAYDSFTNRFYVSVPQINGSGPGGVAQLDISGNVTHFFDFATLGLGAGGVCGPTGLAAGAGGNLIVGCGDGGSSVILHAAANGGNGSIAVINGVGGEDQVWYDPVRHRYFLSARNNPGGPILGIIDAQTETLLQTLASSNGAHSVTVDPVTGEVFMAFGGNLGAVTNSVCPNGCMAVFGLAGAVPEPDTYAMMLAGIGLLGFVARRRKQKAA
jgi:hypothetical protein